MTRIIISGGGTGGHVFPAIAIANALKKRVPDADILFIGAKGRMEMEKVPAAGFRIVGLPVTGFQRSLSPRNLVFPFRLLASLFKAWRVISSFRPEVVIGVGGYASGPTLKIAAMLGIPTIIQEQNSYPGVTNRLLAKRVDRICTAYDGMDKMFPAEKIILTGNPIRQILLSTLVERTDALSHFNLDSTGRTVLVVGGSLGARTVNQAVMAFANTILQKKESLSTPLRVIWQTGKYYYEQVTADLARQYPGKYAPGNFRLEGNGLTLLVRPFLERMELAYPAADLVVSRAGAIAISELCALGKPSILIPSPNVAEDHQTMNARALVKEGAAILVTDAEAVEKLGSIISDTLENNNLLESLGRNSKRLAFADPAGKIADVALKLAGRADAPAVKITEGHVPEDIYFLGIGGIGMSALARFFNRAGFSVSGYDKTETPLTGELTGEGMKIHFTESPDLLPENPGMVIYTPAVPSSHAEVKHLQSIGVQLRKRAEVLGLISRRYLGVAIAGTHGKTTTSSMVAHIFETAGIPYLAFLGGIPKNYGTNFLTNLPESHFKELHPELILTNEGKEIVAGETTTIGGELRDIYCVVEADEYDRSFLRLNPQIAVITSADADHLDIYGTHDDLRNSFSEFTGKIQPSGTLIMRSGVNVVPAVKDKVSVYDYLVNGEAAFTARNLVLAGGLLNFDLHHPGGIIRDLRMNVPGRFNLENAVAAMAAALTSGVGERDLRRAMATYEGVVRRFDLRVNRSDVTYIDDYAHHPEELSACIRAARENYPGRRITGIFQPHLYSRTRDLADGFAQSLDMLDELWLTGIYPARELPIEGVTSSMILDRMTLPRRKLVEKDAILEEIMKNPPDVLLTLGAGDIDQVAGPITTYLSSLPPR